MPVIEPPTFTWLDWLCVLIIVLAAWRGAQRGFLLSTMDILGLAASVLLAAAAAPAVAERLNGVVPLAPRPVVWALSLVALLAATQWIIRALVWALTRLVSGLLGRLRPLAGLNAVLGSLPGALKGFFWLALALVPFASLPIIPPLTRAIREGRISSLVVVQSQELVSRVPALQRVDLTIGVPALNSGALSPTSAVRIRPQLGAIPTGRGRDPLP